MAGCNSHRTLMKASELFKSLLPSVDFSTDPGHRDVNTCATQPDLQCLEEAMIYEPRRTSQWHETIDIAYRSAAIHHVKVRSRHGSIIASPHLLYILFEGQISRRKSVKENMFSHCSPAPFQPFLHSQALKDFNTYSSESSTAR